MHALRIFVHSDCIEALYTSGNSVYNLLGTQLILYNYFRTLHNMTTQFTKRSQGVLQIRQIPRNSAADSDELPRSEPQNVRALFAERPCCGRETSVPSTERPCSDDRRSGSCIIYIRTSRFSVSSANWRSRWNQQLQWKPNPNPC